MKAKTIIEINSRGNLQREMEIKRDSYLEQILNINVIDFFLDKELI